MHFIACNYTSIKLFTMPFLWMGHLLQLRRMRNTEFLWNCKWNNKTKNGIKRQRLSVWIWKKQNKNKILPYTISRNYPHLSKVTTVSRRKIRQEVTPSLIRLAVTLRGVKWKILFIHSFTHSPLTHSPSPPPPLTRFYQRSILWKGFPGGEVIESACQCRRHMFNPWVGRSPGVGCGNPF